MEAIWSKNLMARKRLAKAYIESMFEIKKENVRQAILELRLQKN